MDHLVQLMDNKAKQMQKYTFSDVPLNKQKQKHQHNASVIQFTFNTKMLYLQMIIFNCNGFSWNQYACFINKFQQKS